MESFIKEITNTGVGFRQVSDNTAKIYAGNLRKLAKIVTGTSFHDNHLWLKNYDKVIETLNSQGYAPSTYRNFLSVICVVLQPKAKGEYRKGFEESGKKYALLLAKKKAMALKDAEKQALSPTDLDKWATTAELIKIRQGYAKKLKRDKFNLGKTGRSIDIPLTNKEKELLQKYMVSSLYTMDFTNRNVYGEMEILSSKEYEAICNLGNPYQIMTALQKNYLVIERKGKIQTKFFSLGDTKNSWKHVAGEEKKWRGIDKIPIQKDLNKVINLWLKYKPKNKWFLIGKAWDKPLGRNGLTKFLIKTFKDTGKKISSNIIRKIKNTEEFGKDTTVIKKKEIAKKCGHTVQIQQLHYTKQVEV